MRTIAFVTQKGGSGKSTLAMCVAVAAREAGERVAICDLDPQRSLVTWARHESGNGMSVRAVTAKDLAETLAALGKEKVGLAILDTPAGVSRETQGAIKAADLCIIPARPTILDLWASETIVRAVRAAHKEFAFILNQCPPAQQTQRINEASRALEEIGGLIAPIVASRVDYQLAAQRGQGVTDLNPQGKAAAEMRDVWASIKRRLRGVKAAGAAKPVTAARQANVAAA